MCFVDTYAKAAYQLVRIDKKSGEPLGYDIDGDHCVDIPLHRLTSYQTNKSSQKTSETYPKTFWKVLRGSSFCSPGSYEAGFVAEHSASGVWGTMLLATCPGKVRRACKQIISIKLIALSMPRSAPSENPPKLI